MEILLLIIRLVLFGVFAVAGVAKLLDLKGSEKAAKAFGAPDAAAKQIGVLLPIAELIFAGCLLFTTYSWIGSVGALLLLVIFIGGMLWQLKQGNAPDCHCFGQIHSEPVSWKSIARNILIALLPILLISAGRNNQGLALGDTTSVMIQNLLLAVLSVAAIISVSYIYRLIKENSDLKYRLELVELMDTGGQPVERAASGDPTDSLPIGAPFPDFSLSDTNGRIVTFEHLLVDFKPKVFMFVGPDCGPCKLLLEDFAAWKKEFEPDIRIIFISKGSEEDNRERFGSLADGMLLQNGMEFANKLYIKWTPAAIFVSADGNIAGHPAVGDVAIRDMMARLRNEDHTVPNFYLENGRKHTRLKLGQPVPDFTLTDLDGNAVNKEFFSGNQTIAFFVTTTCAYCAEVIDQLRIWEASPEKNGFNAIVFSDGDPDLHRSYGLKTPIVLDKDYKVSANIGMYGAPCAILIDENMKVASETAVGGPMIWSLIGK